MKEYLPSSISYSDYLAGEIGFTVKEKQRASRKLHVTRKARWSEAEIPLCGTVESLI
jgi:hypothetical protein